MSGVEFWSCCLTSVSLSFLNCQYQPDSTVDTIIKDKVYKVLDLVSDACVLIIMLLLISLLLFSASFIFFRNQAISLFIAADSNIDEIRAVKNKL